MRRNQSVRAAATSTQRSTRTPRPVVRTVPITDQEAVQLSDCNCSKLPGIHTAFHCGNY